MHGPINVKTHCLFLLKKTLSEICGKNYIRRYSAGAKQA